jgi:hypothetical protein
MNQFDNNSVEYYINQLKSYKEKKFSSIPKKIRLEKKFVIECLKEEKIQKRINIKEFPTEYLNDEEICKLSIKFDGKSIKHFSNKLKEDFNIIKESIIKSNGISKKYIKFEYLMNYEIYSLLDFKSIKIILFFQENSIKYSEEVLRFSISNKYFNILKYIKEKDENNFKLLMNNIKFINFLNDIDYLYPIFKLNVVNNENYDFFKKFFKGFIYF